jgi:hypothetical protein
VEDTTLDTIERGVVVALGLLVGAGALVDLRQFRRHRQTFSSLIWLLQRNKWARASMILGWLGLTAHLFVEPVVKPRKRAQVIVEPLAVVEAPLAVS